MFGYGVEPRSGHVDLRQVFISLLFFIMSTSGSSLFIKYIIALVVEHLLPTCDVGVCCLWFETRTGDHDEAYCFMPSLVDLLMSNLCNLMLFIVISVSFGNIC